MTTERTRRPVGRLLDEAEEALRKREWQSVSEKAQDALALDPENADAKAFLAAAERALGTAPSASSTATPSPANVGAHGRAPLQTAPNQAPPPVHPASFVGGRYTVKRFLGEGGKKKVYLAHDTRLDRDVAFALVKTEGLDEVAKARITREAQAMGRLGTS